VKTNFYFALRPIFRKQQCLSFFPLPQGQGALRRSVGGLHALSLREVGRAPGPCTPQNRLGGWPLAQGMLLIPANFHLLLPEVPMPRVLEILIVVLLLLWILGGFVVPVGSNLIHLLLVVILVVVLLRVLPGRGARV
jgi:hypothetical protein